MKITLLSFLFLLLILNVNGWCKLYEQSYDKKDTRGECAKKRILPEQKITDETRFLLALAKLIPKCKYVKKKKCASLCLEKGKCKHICFDILQKKCEKRIWSFILLFRLFIRVTAAKHIQSNHWNKIKLNSQIFCHYLENIIIIWN